MKWLLKKLKLFQGQSGISLLETLVAVSILAATGVAFMGALYTGYRSVGIMDEKQQAEALARSQLEQIKSTTYSDAASYPVTVSLPPQYSMSITVTSPMHIGTADNNTPLDTLMGTHITTIQEITVHILHGGKPVLAVGCYKVK